MAKIPRVTLTLPNFKGFRRPKNPSTIARRPSVEIAKDYVELDFKALIDADRLQRMSPKERRRQAKLAKRRDPVWIKQRHIIHVVTSITVILIVVFSSACAWWTVSTKPVNANDSTIRQFVIGKGMSSMSVANALQKAGFIRNPLAFYIYVKFYGGNVQAGTHMLSQSFSLAKIAQTLAKSANSQVNIQIPPGLTLDKLKENFKHYDYTDQEINEAFSKHYDKPILRYKPADATLEGYLYPDTYRMLAGDSLQKVIERSLDEYYKVLKDNKLLDGFAQQNLNLHQAITLASIVTREVSNANDQGKVSGVFFNRLRRGMALGSDVTFKYAFSQGLCKNEDPKEANSPRCDSVYNTRINAGLPPGPIANPTLTALKAVAHPTLTSAMYFVAGDDGKTYFSDTVDQHNRAIADHCHELCR